MLAYYINNVPLALATDSSVRITWYNPACYFDEIPGDVAMGIDLPVNEVNRAILGNPERFEKYSVKNDREFPNFEIRFSGRILFAGTLVIQSTTKDSYSGWCRNNVGNLGKEHREKFISDIPAFNQDITFENKAIYNPLTDPYGCPKHFNPDFFRDKGHIVNLTRKVPNPDYVDLSKWSGFWEDIWGKPQKPYIDEPYKTEALTEAFRRSSAFFVNDLNPNNTVKLAESISDSKTIEKTLVVNVLSPMLFLNFVIEMLLRDSRFFINTNAITADIDMRNLILYNNFDVTKVEFITEFITDQGVYVKDKYFEGYMLQSSALFSILKIKRSLDFTFKYSDLLPQIKLKDFILSIQNLLNVCFFFHRDGKMDIIDRESLITSVPIDLSNYLVGTWDIAEKKDVTLKFLFTHDDNDIMFSERWEDIDDLRISEGDAVDTWAALELIGNPKIGELRYIRDNNIYVQYKWIQVPQVDPKTGDEVMVDTVGWKHITTGFQNGFFNRKKTNEVEEIKTGFSTLAGGQQTMTLHKGNMETDLLAYENFTPRLLFYFSNRICKNHGYNIALDWEKKDTGLLATRWPKWNKFWSQRQPVSIEAMLPINMIDYVTRNITNRFRSREGTFFIETLETEFSLETIGNTTIKGYKSNYLPLTVPLDEHWAPGNLIMDDTLLDFDKKNMNFDTGLDLFPYNKL